MWTRPWIRSYEYERAVGSGRRQHAPSGGGDVFERGHATSSPSGALAGSPDQREPGTTSKIAGKSLRRLGAAAPELREVHTAGQARVTTLIYGMWHRLYEIS